MTHEILEVSGCKKNLVVELAAEQVEEEIGILARKYAQRARVPGFRPGKVPLHVIKQRYAADLRSDVTQELISRHWKEAVVEYDLKPLADPAVESVQSEPGQPLKFTVSFEVMPVLEVDNYRGITVSVPTAAVEETDVDKALESLRDQHAQFVPVDDAEIRDGHIVTLNLHAEFEDGSKPLDEEDVTIWVGGPQTHQAFTENLLGARAGETRSFDVAFPEDHHRKRFAGKRVHYRLEIKDVKEKQAPELSDDFAADIGGGSLEELRLKLKDDLVTKARRTAEEKAKEEVVDKVVRAHSFDVPECLIRVEMEARARNIASNLAEQGIDVSRTSIDWKRVFDEERPFAEKAVRRRMVLEAIARRENLEVTEEMLEGEFQKIAAAANKSALAIRAQFEKDERIQEFRAYLRQNMALDFIYRNANIS